MKIALATILSLAAVATADEDSSNNVFLRTTKSSNDVPQLSACNQQSDQASCFRTVDDESGLPCSWCVAGAIPSECVPQEQAAQLPEAVFECSTPGMTVYTNFVEGHSHSFYSKEGNDDLCDSSPKSISGYMDIKGSDYDKDGQNKHLFYWMFEKRGESAEDTPYVVSSFMSTYLSRRRSCPAGMCLSGTCAH